MIFSSPEFVLLFLPLTFFIYFIFNKFRLVVAGKASLVAASLFFYGYWSVKFLPLLLGSIIFNFVAGKALSPDFKTVPEGLSRRFMLIVGISANLGLLGYYKYANFFVDNINVLVGSSYDIPRIILPLGISFFTFTQIAYLVDSWQGKAKEYSFLNYVLFVTFFPHLIAGPILHHREMMSQFESRWTLVKRYRNIYMGLFIFSVGFFKKVVIADTFAAWADAGFDGSAHLEFFGGWATSLSYTFQLYFDFSGYCDMAIGAALLFNIWLPLNFNSPYKSLDIQDFWRRWHMTLSRYLRDYLYIPLGGNRCSTWRIYLNLMITFVLGGLWHGASWMFVIWGACHGIALVLHRIWGSLGFRLPKMMAWFVTFNFVNVTWVFFRAKSLGDAHRVISGMLDVGSLFGSPVAAIPSKNLAWAGWLSDHLLVWLPHGLAANVLCFGAIAVGLLIISQRNSFELMKDSVRSPAIFHFGILLFVIAMYSAMLTTSSVFLYFNF